MSKILTSDNVFKPYRENRIIFLKGHIDSDRIDKFSVNHAMAILPILDTDNQKPIKLVISSHGGHVFPGLALYDIMQLIKSPVYTIGMGRCASMAAILLSSGEPGHRYIFPNTRVVVHKMQAGAIGTAGEMIKSTEEIEFVNETLLKIVKKHCRRRERIKKIEKDWVDTLRMSAQEAKDYGIVDQIVTSQIMQEIFEFSAALENGKKDKKDKKDKKEKK